MFRKTWKSWLSPQFVNLEALLQSKKVTVIELTEMYLDAIETVQSATCLFS